MELQAYSSVTSTTNIQFFTRKLVTQSEIFFLCRLIIIGDDVINQKKTVAMKKYFLLVVKAVHYSATSTV